MLDLRKMLKENIIFLDGATGTNLQQVGMPAGVCPEQWILEHPQVLLKLQKAYVKAGTQILYAPTFSGNGIKLKEYGLENRLVEINQKLVALTREAAGNECLVAGNLTMTGRSLTPMGDLDFEELVECYKEQVRAIAEAGVDLFVIETMMSIQECRAAVLAVKETTDLPVFVTITLEENGTTLYGTDPVTALISMEALGVDAFGINCSCGPDTLLPIMEELVEYAHIPLIAKPNAGIPKLIDGKTVFDMSEDCFAEHMAKLAEAGAVILGGCCGTNPRYIAAMRKHVKAREKREAAKKRRILTSERERVEITLDGAFLMVGERINPTGKKKLQEELREGNLTLVLDMAREQTNQGAAVLDINVGMGGIDEAEMMLQVLEQVGQQVATPLCIDSSDIQVVEKALRRYPGRALVNSISCEPHKLEKLLPVVKKYGAMFILLPMRESGLPKNQKERKENIQQIIQKAWELGFSKEDIVVDGLVAAVAAQPNAAKDTLETIAWCHKVGLASICGLSNISFGLPDRGYVNSVFLAMAIERGLTMAIVNPAQELFQRSRLAADLLMGKADASLRYVEYSNRRREAAEKWAAENETMSAGFRKKEEMLKLAEMQPGSVNLGGCSKYELWKEQIRQDVLKGSEKKIGEHILSALELGKNRIKTAEELLHQVLIPAINEVGELFNQQKYFLPQLIISAKAMEAGVAELEPILWEQHKGEKGPLVVLATVKGDVHDIGKNLVAMMMRNYGFRVVDLGKDVDKEMIVAAAVEYKADIIGLSALMTTTMSYMKEVIREVQQSGLSAKVIVGGAAVTREYAKEIGADGYSEDAVGAVELVKNLLTGKKK